MDRLALYRSSSDILNPLFMISFPLQYTFLNHALHLSEPVYAIFIQGRSTLCHVLPQFEAAKLAIACETVSVTMSPYKEADESREIRSYGHQYINAIQVINEVIQR